VADWLIRGVHAFKRSRLASLGPFRLLRVSLVLIRTKILFSHLNMRFTQATTAICIIIGSFNFFV